MTAAEARNQVTVRLDAPELGLQNVVGTLSRQPGRGGDVISFSYNPDWLDAPGSFQIDPGLPLFEGDQYTVDLPGILADAAPDRWGRTLLERREALEARREERRPQTLYEWDFLVGVDDRTRMGALRLFDEGQKAVSAGPFSVPPHTRLRELEHLAREHEEGALEERTEEDRWIAMLMAPGSSLGGARPKANFIGDDESLWIAKFPSTGDRRDYGRWEYSLSQLARAAGIAVPTTMLLELDARYATFCSRRFDRAGDERRLYASAMTLTGRKDNEDASYLDIAQAIISFGDPAWITADLEQMFRRAVFNVMVGNRDDHLRNHGFLRGPNGWRLAPAFDVNPSPEKYEHSLALDDTVRDPDLGVLTSTAPLYRLIAARADAVIAEVATAVADWREVARSAAIPGGEIDLVSPSFDVARAG